MEIKNNQGYVALIAVLIILAVGLIIGVSAVLNSVNEMQMGYANDESEEAFTIADACANEAIIRLKRDRNLMEIENLSIGNGSCIIEIQNLGGNNRRLKISGEVNNKFRLIEVELVVGSNWQVTSWKEAGAFTP